MAAEPWYLVSNLDPSLERSGLRDPERIDRLLLVVAIAVLVSHLQGDAVSLAADPTAGVGAVHAQSRRQETAEQALVLTD